MSNKYDKMENYIISVFNLFQMVNKKAEQQNDKRLKIISLTIYNYARYMANKYEIDIKNIIEPVNINLIPVFEYISANNIELYDFSNITPTGKKNETKRSYDLYIL